MDDFLFKARSGYCEHFATAMTLMLRAVGVPARMVSGFAGGEWNEYGGFYLVREQDAHTWVEVYFPKSGWAPFDPTPPSVSEGKPLPIISGIGRMLDFVRYKWDRYIVYYTLRDQLAAAGKAADTYRSVRLWVVGMAASIKEELTRTAVEGKAAGPTHARHVILVIPIVLAILLFIGYLALKALNAGRLGRKGSGVWFYDEMVGVLKKKGIVRPPGVTPLEFAKSASQRGGVYKVLTYVTELYNRVRFGGRPISRDEKARVRKVIEGLKRAR
jgi:hypothetical protein